MLSVPAHKVRRRAGVGAQTAAGGYGVGSGEDGSRVWGQPPAAAEGSGHPEGLPEHGPCCWAWCLAVNACTIDSGFLLSSAGLEGWGTVGLPAQLALHRALVDCCSERERGGGGGGGGGGDGTDVFKVYVYSVCFGVLLRHDREVHSSGGSQSFSYAGGVTCNASRHAHDARCTGKSGIKLRSNRSCRPQIVAESSWPARRRCRLQ